MKPAFKTSPTVKAIRNDIRSRVLPARLAVIFGSALLVSGIAPRNADFPRALPAQHAKVPVTLERDTGLGRDQEQAQKPTAGNPPRRQLCRKRAKITKEKNKSGGNGNGESRK